MFRAVACLLVAASASAAIADEKPKKKPEAGKADKSARKAEELKWAKGVAEDFLTAGSRSEYVQAAMLMSDEMKKSLAGTSEPATTFLQNRFGNYLQGAQTRTVTTEAISPDQDEATFKGTIRKDDAEAEFTVRVAKEKDGGKWRVNFFTATPLEKKVKPEKK